MYYLITSIHYDLWIFELENCDDEIVNLIADIFELDGITIRPVIKGTAIMNKNRLDSKDDLIELLDHKLTTLDDDYEIEKIARLKQML